MYTNYKRNIVSVFILFFSVIAAKSDDYEDDSCVSLSTTKMVMEAAGGKWMELTNNQWQFARGWFTMSPNTPEGLPYGDKAAVAIVPRHLPVLFFIDGDFACDPLNVSAPLFELLKRVDEEPNKRKGT